ncbi:MAG TPA: Fe2+-dependent dioxygenase [Rhizomicrobium sp.]|nr:Fe2+-dependent dioxygenase [Rhizomicrobium sp.]
MIVILEDLLDPIEVTRIRDTLARAQWQDGANTAGRHARMVKNNEQAKGPDVDAARRLIADALARNEHFKMAALPRAMTPIMFSRYKPGMEYGTHIDNAMMTSATGRMRCDLAMTVFLSDPETYSGGGLSISGIAQNEIRLPAGSAVLYPATTLHRVTPVESGERLAAILWVQSLVREDAARETIYDLATARRMLLDTEGKTEAFDLIAKSHANLMRRWAEV